jgi:hypothetical protein
MKTFSKDIVVYCDAPSITDDELCFCWGESSVTLNWWEGKTRALKMFKAEGWLLGDKDICPYHNKKIKMP